MSSGDNNKMFLVRLTWAAFSSPSRRINSRHIFRWFLFGGGLGVASVWKCFSQPASTGTCVVSFCRNSFSPEEIHVVPVYSKVTRDAWGATENTTPPTTFIPNWKAISRFTALKQNETNLFLFVLFVFLFSFYKLFSSSGFTLFSVF